MHKLPGSLLAMGIVLCLVTAAAVAALTVRHRSAEAQEIDQRRATVAAGPFVNVVKVVVGPPERTLTLSAEVRANQRATLYAKVSGYLREIHVDKGDRVRKGQLLALLESPEADEGLNSAQADLALREQMVRRQRALTPQGFSSQGELDQAEAAVKVARSAVERARAQKAYEELRAPFDGVITARYADPGALLPAATASTTAAQPLLEVADVDRLRIAVQLGQSEAGLVHAGDPISIDTGDGAPLTLQITRVTRSLDARTRTMLAEVDLRRAPQGLLPGAFVQASLALRGPPHPIIPTEALLSLDGNLVVPLVVAGRLHLVPVKTGIDDGRTVEVLSGLRGGELVALNLGSDAVEGAAVQAATAQAAAAR